MDPVTFYSNIEVCRICPNTHNLTSLYLPTQRAALDTLKLIINIKEAQLPKYICGNCEIDLLNFIEFKGKCERRETELLDNIRLVETNHVEIKQELTLVAEDITVDSEFKIEEYNVSDNGDDNSTSSIDSETPIDSIKCEQVLDDEIIKPAKSKPTEYPCPICCEIFPKYLKLQEHKRTHKTCPDCLKVYKTFALMFSHRRVHTKFPYSCPICNMGLAFSRELYDHKKLSHKQCPDCLKDFDSYGLMIQHRESVHGKKTDIIAGKVACPICGKEVRHLNRHIRCKHSDNNKLRDKNSAERFPCPYPNCDKTFQIKVNINKHVRSIHLKERNYSCDVCDMSFFELAQLKNHASIHNIFRPQTCEFPDCNETFTTELTMKLHKNTHLKPEDRVHINNKQGVSWVCSYCGKVFYSKNGHDTHLLIHTNEKPKECDICHMKFRSSLSLLNHKRIHSKEKPYECKICKTRFRQQGHLITHMLTHDPEKKFACTICDMTTKFKHNLYAHMKTVHQIENFKPQSSIR